MSDRIFLRLNEDFALGADSLQWILYRRHAAVPEGSPLPLRDWRPISFVHFTKGILLRCMREKGCKPSHEAQVALDGMPPTFEAWKRLSSAHFFRHSCNCNHSGICPAIAVICCGRS
jgi:hypothetical protein